MSTTTSPQPNPTASATPQRNFFIFGHNIAHSLSPTLHHAGFRALALRHHHYAIHESPEIDATNEALLAAPSFAGASVTFPHKLQVARLLDALSPSAAAIGAVNTVVVRHADDGGKRELVGENTDWLGIRACVERAARGGRAGRAALALGAGGAARAACYALRTLGVGEIVVVNRTRSRAEELAEGFPGTRFRVFESLEEAVGAGVKGVGVVVACVPADELTEERVPRGLFEGAAEGGVLVEMAYRPPETGMMRVARACPGWEVFCGTDVLEEQAFAQFELWTGRKAPVEALREAMRVEVERRSRL